MRADKRPQIFDPSADAYRDATQVDVDRLQALAPRYWALRKALHEEIAKGRRLPVRLTKLFAQQEELIERETGRTAAERFHQVSSRAQEAHTS